MNKITPLSLSLLMLTAHSFASEEYCINPAIDFGSSSLLIDRKVLINEKLGVVSFDVTPLNKGLWLLKMKDQTELSARINDTDKGFDIKLMGNGYVYQCFYDESDRSAMLAKIELAKAEKEAKEKEERAKRLADQERKAEEQAVAAIASERLARSIASAIDQKVRRNWRVPVGADELEVHLRINLAPTGDVLAVNVARSSGNVSFDNSARMAVQKSSPFREMNKLSASEFENNFRRFTMIFLP